MSYYEEEDEQEREPRTLPDMYIEPEACCVVCGVQNSVERPMNWACSACGGATHTECGADTEPSGGWDRDYDINYWVCNICLQRGPNPPDGFVEVAGLTFAYSNHKSLTVTIDGQARVLNTEETRDLVAFLYDLRGELFLDDKKVSEELVLAFDGPLGTLDDHPF